MHRISVINKAIIEKNLDMKVAVEAVKKAYILNAHKEVELFNTVFHDFKETTADLDIKSGNISKEGIFGFKMMTWFQDNAQKNIPTLNGMIMLFDNHTGVPIALLDAEYITGMRTGAAAGIGTKYLAREASENMLMIGCGNQAPFQIAATLLLMDNVKKVFLYDPISYENAVKFSKEIKRILLNDFLSKFDEDKDLYECYRTKIDIHFDAIEDIEEATKNADIITTATPSRKPLIKKEWVKEGTHITCMGADMEGKQEIDENLFSVAKVFVDDIEKTSKVGEMESAIKKGIFLKEDIVCEIGEVIKGQKRGRSTDKEITIFDASGLATQDLMTANFLFKLANKKELGIEIEL
ncbi:ornithine cyclodeaminase family protein [Clostridiaceae bacterium 35-E11]